MPDLKLSDKQLFNLVKQLSPEKKGELVDYLVLEVDERFRRLCKTGGGKFLRICKDRNIDPSALSEEMKLKLIDEILHEK